MEDNTKDNMKDNMKSNTYITNNSAQTKKMGKMLAEEILKSKESKKHAFVICLKGDLGSGKTTFLQGFAKGLSIREKILSPTFVIMKKFKIPKRKNVHGSRFPAHSLYHFDCYRIGKPKEILELGFEKIISCSNNIVAIEWPEKINKLLPKNTLMLKFEFLDENTRKITFSN
ncbi:MAG: tRNA (adenosine(37)-N6)-threonylcarbamoyltransferase complex ATPase subunit type 1 TsaE [Patescibacteria group bacterium]|nr:tRNA (adenosine(37)-N6)-threonylcarbamoyltransferase complex ATPase subunit type 1 TsaE [Patescibacteria group bacterium]